MKNDTKSSPLRGPARRSGGDRRGAFLLIMLLSFTLNAQTYVTDYNYDYSRTLVMKVVISVPDLKGGTKIFNNFDQALEIVKQADALSLGIPKIIYLVGWQYNGHDDKYPEMFEVNKALRRQGDKDARESLLWLMEEAKKYNTIVSLHINMTDAYDDSTLWDEYVKNDMISKTRTGHLMRIGHYNDKDAYQINYKNEWEKGYTKMRIDKLLDLLPPLREAGTIHIDAWIARNSEGQYKSMVTEAEYQKKALAYWRKKGLDVTSEWVMDYMVGLVPFAWHFNAMSQEGYLKIPANVYTGSGLNPDVPNTDFALGFLFGKSMYGETVFPAISLGKRVDEWQDLFVRDFFENVLQYNYLNRHKRLRVEGEGNNRVAYFSYGVKVSLVDSTVTDHGLLLREKDFVFFPVLWKEEKEIATYSKTDLTRIVTLPESWRCEKRLKLYKVTGEGLVFVKNIPVKKRTVKLILKGGTGYVIKRE